MKDFESIRVTASWIASGCGFVIKVLDLPRIDTPQLLFRAIQLFFIDITTLRDLSLQKYVADEYDQSF